MQRKKISYSLGFNFDSKLVDGIIFVNSQSSGISKIDEVFGALPDCPISSARPSSKIPNINWREFSAQIGKLSHSNIEFNFLMNTAQALDYSLKKAIKLYLSKLRDIGIKRLTLGTPELCEIVKDMFPFFHVTISITYGTRSKLKLSQAEKAGADAVYLDGVYVNRDFRLLRSLVKAAGIECRLYANMSCLSACPVVHNHYGIFAGTQNNETDQQNDAFFAGCTLVKMSNPVEWIQMPWIRPEDIKVYKSQGIHHFKLADRLAPTETLLNIAQSYVQGISPDNLFTLMERNGSKYKIFNIDPPIYQEATPIYVENRNIPQDFIEHFRNEACRSNDTSCVICSNVATKAVHIRANLKSATLSPATVELIPWKLRKRVGS